VVGRPKGDDGNQTYARHDVPLLHSTGARGSAFGGGANRAPSGVGPLAGTRPRRKGRGQSHAAGAQISHTVAQGGKI